ncbi:MAG: hypothetical protein H7Y08_10320 [Rhizobiaceae bacterium]|nr:hypothetical protein [Rhizobiaceae bacterium]
MNELETPSRPEGHSPAATIASVAAEWIPSGELVDARVCGFDGRTRDVPLSTLLDEFASALLARTGRVTRRIAWPTKANRFIELDATFVRLQGGDGSEDLIILTAIAGHSANGVDPARHLDTAFGQHIAAIKAPISGDWPSEGVEDGVAAGRTEREALSVGHAQTLAATMIAVAGDLRHLSELAMSALQWEAAGESSRPSALREAPRSPVPKS